MKVLHVISSLAPRAGGPTRVLQQLARVQAAAGMQVTICTSNADNPSGTLPVPTDQPLREHGVTLCYHRIQFAPLLVSLPMARWLHQHIGEFDIVHIHGLYRFPPSYAAWYANRRGIPYLIRPHGGLDPYLHQQSSVSVRLKRLYERLIDLPNLHHADAIQFTTRQEQQLTKPLQLRAPAIIVPNGLDWSDFAELPARGAFRARLGLSAETPLLLFLGRINFKKGLDLLIPAFARLQKTIKEATLAIVGPDNEGLGVEVRRWCQQAGVQDRVHFSEHLPAEQVRQAYRDADLFVLPSYTENFGMTVIEAMACECPVVISDQVNICEDIRQAQVGRVVSLDAGEIGDTLREMLANPAATREMATRGRAHVRKHYTWDTVSGQLTGEYERLLQRHALRHH